MVAESLPQSLPIHSVKLRGKITTLRPLDATLRCSRRQTRCHAASEPDPAAADAPALSAWPMPREPGGTAVPPEPVTCGTQRERPTHVSLTSAPVATPGDQPPDDCLDDVHPQHCRWCFAGGQASRVRSALTCAAIAPGTDATFAALSDPEWRPPAPLHDVPAALLNFQPDAPAVLTNAAIAQALRTARRGTAAGLSGATCEHYKLILTRPWRRRPRDRDRLRRLVLARQYADTFDRATRPFELALQARAGTDCLAAMLRAASELNADATDARGREWDAARQIAFLPAATGTLGLASAPCLRAAAAAGDRLLTEGWGARPEWDDLLRGAAEVWWTSWSTIAREAVAAEGVVVPVCSVIAATVPSFVWGCPNFPSSPRALRAAARAGADGGGSSDARCSALASAGAAHRRRAHNARVGPGVRRAAVTINNDVAVAALAEWRADPRAASWWEEARHVLMASEPVSPQTLLAAVVRAVEAASTHEHHPPDLVSRIQDAWLPSSARVHVGWAVRQLREPDAYLLAPVQEALLECYRGMQLASALDRHSDRFRAMPVPGAASPHGEAAETSARSGRGRRRGRGRGVPPASGARQRDHDSSGSDTGAAPVPDHAQVPDRQPVSLPDFPRAAWQWLDGLDLLAELRRQVPTLHTVPRFLAAGVRHALVSALQAIRVAHEGRDDVARVRAWKLFLLLPRLLLARCFETGGEGRAVLLRRVQLFREGRWDSLHGQLGAVPSRTRQPTTPDASEARAAAACARVRRGEISRARQVLTAAALAPGDEATLRALTDPSRRPPQPLRPVPQHVMNHHPAEEVALSKQQVADALRTSKRGSAAGLSGTTVEFYKLLLDDEGALEAFTFVVNVAVRAQAPPVALDALALSRLTALRKPQGGVSPGEEAAWTAARLGAFLPPSLGGLGVLAAERVVGGRWGEECQRFVRQLLRLRVQRAPATLRATAAQGWARRWWGLLSVAVQRAVASTALGVWTMRKGKGKEGKATAKAVDHLLSSA
ncbi:unnamed protein product [Symbiodinium natans]|uniref:Uncharacterized protein n=1 Tax=Symbiodinium natans TaxID=878477 RepID=A0A812TMK3_9DINO|nr:unnamed protein product [Symbiodinium natans]